MIAADIIRNATAAGITLAARGDQLAVVPATNLSPDLRALLVAHKLELLDLLRRPANNTHPRNRKVQPTYGTGRDARGRPLAPLVTCGECIHFTRNRDNPVIGIGTCQLGEPDLGGWPFHPGARRCCSRHANP